MSVTNKRSEFTGIERAAADACDFALVVAELLIRIRLVAQLDAVAWLDEPNGATRYQQFNLEPGIAGQEAEQGLPSLHGLARLYQLSGYRARHRCIDG